MRLLSVLACITIFALACSEQPEPQSQTQTSKAQADTAATSTATAEPEHIEVQHILIGFQGSLPGRNVTRSQAEAQQLALQVLAMAQQGEDFDGLVRQYTNDAFPGKYKMSNFGIAADASQQEYPRQGMVPAFGNVGFKLKVGEVGMAPYDTQNSPYGWHIIKRVQ